MYPSPRIPTPPRAETYDRRTICLHWLTAALVAALCIIAQVIDDFQRGMPRIGARGELPDRRCDPLEIARLPRRASVG